MDGIGRIAKRVIVASQSPTEPLPRELPGKLLRGPKGSKRELISKLRRTVRALAAKSSLLLDNVAAFESEGMFPGKERNIVELLSLVWNPDEAERIMQEIKRFETQEREE